jgi:iron complex outermembrane receptor protein
LKPEIRTGRAGVLPFLLLTLASALACLCAHPAHAQRAGENAVTSADDAFGSSVGTEKIGIYSDTDVRGFNPVRAGNLRIEGIYFDQQSGLTGRVRAGLRIRVGIAALDYPFPAPSGIVDYKLRTSGDAPVASLALLRQNYGGPNIEIDLSGPIIKGRLSIAGGVTRNHDEAVDGSSFTNYGVGLLPKWRFNGGELTLLVSHIAQRDATSRIVISSPGAFLPPLPEPRRYLGQDWARASTDSTNFGAFARADLGKSWSVRAGAFQSQALKRRGYSEIFVVDDPLGNARHSIVADPRQLARSYSGEVQVTWRGGQGRLSQRVILNLRGRSRHGETGGSDRRDFGSIRLGEVDPEPKPTFSFGPTDESRVRQITAGIGYVARFDRFAQLNVGLQKTSYRASFQRLGQDTATTDEPWLYNATLVVSPSNRWLAYAGLNRGLEESGVAPENAANRNETLAASRTTQFDGGVRIRLGSTQLMLSAFQIGKPYFTFDANNRFTDLGDVRHRGLEASLSGSIGGRLTIVGGGVLMQPRVTGEARTLGRVGPRPVGVAPILLRLDAEYRLPTPGLSLTGSTVYTGRRAASSRTYSALGGDQLFTKATTTVDLGVRYRLKLGDHPVSARVLLANALNKRSFRILAANSYQQDEARRLAVNILADF